MKWIVGGTIVIALIGVGTYLNAWGIAAQLLPLIGQTKHIPVSPPSSFTVPAGFAVFVYADTVPGARVLARDPRGVLVVSQTSEGKVTALPDDNNDGAADRAVPILSDVNGPHGILFRCGGYGPTDGASTDCSLYVAESDKVVRYAYDVATFAASYAETLVGLPDDGGHSTRTLYLHSDGRRLLVSVGSSCNVCIEDDERRAAVLAVDLQSESSTIFARGLRNSVFMALHPLTGDVWATEMGRDLLGDDIPPDEINIIKEDKNYGWPICYGKNIHDTQFDKNTYIRAPCTEPFEVPSLIDVPAHSAPLGIAFFGEESWPEDYWHDALVALHGSWNRSTPAGYKVVRYHVDDKGMPTGVVSDFMTGFIKPGGEIIGRPAGVMIEPNAVYISDDRAGAIYRISRVAL